MLNKLNTILNYAISSFLGVFVGSSLFRYFHYKNKPGLYEIQSAPWYTGIQVNAIITVAIILVLIILKFAIKKYILKEKS